MALPLIVAVILALGWALPAAAAGQSYAEAPMRVQTKGLTAEQHVRQQIELSAGLTRELPAEAQQKAIHVPLSAAEIASIDKAAPSSAPLRIGIVKALAPAIEVGGLDSASGLAFQTSDGRPAWALVVRSEGAGAIRLHVHDMWLPPGVELYVFTRTGQAFGPYTGPGPNGTGDFWTTAVFSAEAILELRFPASVSPADLQSASFRVVEAGLITETFARGLRESALEPPSPFEKAGPGPATWPCGNKTCIVDASCVSNTPADPAKLAVAKYEWISGAYIYTCTGGLISDNNPTQSNFFLSANHCISKNTNAQNATFYWRFATSSCDGSCPANSGWPYQTTGATVSSSNRRGDYTLMHLNASPPSGSVFLGWSSAPVANTNSAHLYRISNPQFGPQVYSQHDVDTSAPTCTGWPRGERIYSRDMTGAIDGGSSGSPVLNASSQIVGQLSGTCGYSASDPCASGPGEANATVDGAFAFYYSTVQPILNP